MGKDIYKNFDWDKFKDYVNTYKPQEHGLNIPDVVLEDMLYGLGISLNSKEYKMRDGYEKFKQDLIKFIEEKTL